MALRHAGCEYPTKQSFLPPPLMLDSAACAPLMRTFAQSGNIPSIAASARYCINNSSIAMPHTISTTRAHPGKRRFSLAGGFDIVRTDGSDGTKAHFAPGRNIRQPSRG